jgi:hypothetical protein
MTVHAKEAIQKYLEGLGEDVKMWSEPVNMGSDIWHALVALSPTGPLIVAEFKLKIEKPS